MKISFELSRPNGQAAGTVSGSVIRSPVALPQHAEILRELKSHNKKQSRMYDSAVTTQLNMDFPSTYGSPNAELLTSLYISRNRARTLVKDYPIAKGIVRNDRNNVVGDDPFRLEMKVGTRDANGKLTLESDINEMIEAAWKEAGDPEFCTVRKTWSRLELYHMVESEVMTAGGVLARHYNGFDNDFGYAIDCLEIDRLDQNYMGKSEAGNDIRFSIEFDANGAPVAYWILTRHPGDVFGYTKLATGKPNVWRIRVPADEMIHFANMRDRAEQDVGMTELDSVIQQLHRDRQFDIAHVYAAIWASCKPFFIVQEFPTGLPYAGDPSMLMNQAGGGGEAISGGASDAKGGGANRVKVQEPASGEILPWGQKPMLVDPKFPVESAVGFKKNNLEAVGMGVGQSYAAVSNDYTGLSFSAARMAAIPERDNYKVRQKHMIASFVQKHFRQWLKNAMLTPYFQERFGKSLPMSRYKEFCRAAHFHGKRWGYINPLQDAQTDILLVEAGFRAPQEVRAESENEGSIEDVYRHISEAKEIADDYGLNFGGDATLPTVAKGPPTDEETTSVAAPAPPAKTGGKNVFNSKSLRKRMAAATLLLNQMDDYGEPTNGKLGKSKTH